jgi:hypothetical protein
VTTQSEEEKMKERIAVFAAVAATLLLSYSTPALTGEAVPAAIAAAIADASRPQANVALDARRFGRHGTVLSKGGRRSDTSSKCAAGELRSLQPFSGDRSAFSGRSATRMMRWML